jgi:hypothetical protein
MESGVCDGPLCLDGSRKRCGRELALYSLEIGPEYHSLQRRTDRIYNGEIEQIVSVVSSVPNTAKMG